MPKKKPSERIEELRKEASDLIKKNINNIAFRSCWKCNAAHEHLKKSEYVIDCFQCGHFYYKGVDITEDSK